MARELEHAPVEGAPHTWTLGWRGRAIARLRWQADPARRDRAGWYLSLLDDEEGQRLDVDPAVDRLAGAVGDPEPAWRQHAEAVASLTTDRALDRAEWRLRGADPDQAGRPASGGARRRYELYVADADAVALGLAFPTLASGPHGTGVVLSGTLDFGELDQAVRRLRALGHRVVAVLDADTAPSG